MGHFSHNCKLTGLPITSGKAVLIVMKPQEHLWGNSEESIRKYGKTYMCSNDGPRLKYIPCWYPIRGEYDTYGGLENIVKDDNTAVLEEYYGLTIEELIGIITSGRKEDGYDGALDKIKKKPVYPEGWNKDEDHFDRYQRLTGDKMPFDGHYPDSPGKKYRVYRDGKMVITTKEEYDADFKLIHEHYARYEEWKKTNPDYDDDYGKPEYEDKYKELLTLSGMWIHGDVYDQLTKEKVNDVWRDGVDLGVPELLNALGFVEGKPSRKERYNRTFTKDGLTIHSDGNWINVPNEHIYSLKDLKKYCKKKGVDIDIEEMDKKDMFEQIYDYIVPTFNVPKPFKVPTKEEFEQTKKELAEAKNKAKNKEVAELLELDDDDIMDLISSLSSSITDNSHISMQVYRMFLNTDRYGSTHLKNDLTRVYLEKAKEGKLRSNIVEFWRFDSYMFACGKYYEIVGTGPQDGEHKQVLKVLETAVSILKEEVKDMYDDEWNEDEED